MGRPKAVEKTYSVSHVLILDPVESMPPKLFNRLRKHIGRLYPINRLPHGFQIKVGALGAWLIYRSGNKEYAWAKCLFAKINGKWFNFTYNRWESPQQVLAKSDFRDPIKIRLGFKEHTIEHRIKPLHRRRSPRARAVDESLRAKDAPSEYDWMRSPERFDVEGVDTPKTKKENR